MKNLNFFGENGITATSANHIANMGKELTRKMQDWLAKVQFYNEYIKLIGDADHTLVQSGVTYEDMKNIPVYIESIGQAHALIAYLREAIKMKEQLQKEAERWTNEEARKALQQKRMDLKMPDEPDTVSYEDIIAEWNIGDLEHYLTLQAQCAVLGKFIHEDGSLNKARIAYNEKLTTPREVLLNGRDTVVKEFEPSVEEDDIDGAFFKLQKAHRSNQGELNGMLKSAKDEADRRNLEAMNEYRVALQKYNNDRRALDMEEKEIVTQEDCTRKVMLADVQKLKIVIPNRLKDIYKTISEL